MSTQRIITNRATLIVLFLLGKQLFKEFVLSQLVDFHHLHSGLESSVLPGEVVGHDLVPDHVFVEALALLVNHFGPELARFYL